MKDRLQKLRTLFRIMLKFSFNTHEILNRINFMLKNEAFYTSVNKNSYFLQNVLRNQNTYYLLYAYFSSFFLVISYFTFIKLSVTRKIIKKPTDLFRRSSNCEKHLYFLIPCLVCHFTGFDQVTCLLFSWYFIELGSIQQHHTIYYGLKNINWLNIYILYIPKLTWISWYQEEFWPCGRVLQFVRLISGKTLILRVSNRMLSYCKYAKLAILTG